MSLIPKRILLRCLLRTYLVGAAYNPRGLQNVGFIHALEPGLAVLYPDPASLSEARSRYLRHHNCHPFWAPMLVGLFLHTEANIAAGRFAASSFMAFKDTATNTLSAIGDSVFGGSMLASWALAACACIVAGYPEGALILSGLLFTALQTFKVVTFAAGLRYGVSILLHLRRWDLINWGDKLKLCNALLLLLFLQQILPQNEDWPLWTATISACGALAWLAGKIHIPRSILAFGAVAVLLVISGLKLYTP